MILSRGFAALILSASLATGLAGGVLAQDKPIANDDERIFTAVEDALQRARSLAAARITVRSLDGFVTLTGFAANVDDIATAGRLAAGVPGVTGVNNRIRVADRGSRG